jgi:hypothetical protein
MPVLVIMPVPVTGHATAVPMAESVWGLGMGLSESPIAPSGASVVSVGCGAGLPVPASHTELN